MGKITGVKTAVPVNRDHFLQFLTIIQPAIFPYQDTNQLVGAVMNGILAVCDDSEQRNLAVTRQKCEMCRRMTMEEALAIWMGQLNAKNGRTDEAIQEKPNAVCNH